MTLSHDPGILYLSCPAGHYVPATAQIILESNSIYTKNLKGIGIGNGWVDPYIQYPAYAKVSEREREKEVGDGERERERAGGDRFNSSPLQFAKLENLITEPSFEIANIMFTMCKGTLLMIAVQSLRLP